MSATVQAQPSDAARRKYLRGLCLWAGRSVESYGRSVNAASGATAHCFHWPAWGRLCYMVGDVWTGFNAHGEVATKNGESFTIPEGRWDCRDIVAVDDVLGYKELPNQVRVIFVDGCTVKVIEI